MADDRKDTLASTPCAALVLAFLAVSVARFVVPWLVGLATVSGEGWYGPQGLEARAQLRSIRLRLERGAADDMNRFFPEGRLFSYGFYGFALVNVATASPGDAEFRAHALAELERIIPIMEAEIDAPQFRVSSNLTPRGGVIPEGQANLLRAGYCLLGGEDAAVFARFHESSREMFDAFMASPVASLETYPGMIWPVDSCCALESLRLHDVMFGTDYRAACARWEEWMASHLDPGSGMMVGQITSLGEVLDGPRGCALTWSLAFMSGFAPELARVQYARYRDEWFVHVLGVTGAREWSPGGEGEMDSDTGPVVGGIGAAASGIGIAAAKANGDAGELTSMLRGLELFGLPVWGLDGKDYFAGSVVLADELALWGKTVRVWDAPPAADAPRDWPSPTRWGFWLVWVLALAAAGTLTVFAGRAAVRSVRALRRGGPRWDRTRAVAFAVAAAAIAGWILFSAVGWLYAAAIAAGASAVERRLLLRRGEAPGPRAPPAEPSPPRAVEPAGRAGVERS
ncbi:MAG: hypothetical protein ACYTKD_28065 [Planctomycetota bacterium]|jgi:hypothetical protein